MLGAACPEVPRQQVHGGHAHCDTHFDLFLNDRPVDVVGDLAVDLDPAIHRAGVHNDGIRLGQGQFFRIQSIAVIVFLLRRNKPAVHAFLLEAQHHDDIDVFEPFAHVVINFNAELIDLCGHQGRRSDKADAAFHFTQKQQVGTRHAAVRNVATNRNVEPMQPPLCAADRQGIEKRLRRMFVTAIASVQNGTVNLLRKKIDRAGMWMANHQKIGMHRVQRHRGVDQGFAFFDRTGLHGHIHHVRAQTLSCEFEGCLRPGRIFEEHIDLGKTGQDVRMFGRLPVQFDIVFGEVEKRRDFFGTKGFDAKQVSVRKRHGAALPKLFPAYRKPRTQGQYGPQLLRFSLPSAAAILTGMESGMDYHTARALLEWQVEMGVTDAILDEPLDRFELAEQVPLQKKSQQRTETVVPVVDKADPVVEARQAAAAAKDLDALKAALGAFEHCELKRGARNLVFSDGVRGAPVMIVGEAPGRDEDMRGLPFVGRAGQLLDRMLSAIGLSRDTNVYITNVLPWRPPQNRDPRPEEIAMMKPFLHRHIELARPKVLVLMGNHSCQAVIGQRGITRLRGKWSEGFGYPALPMFHPAYLLRNPAAKRDAWADLLDLSARLGQDS